MSTSRMFVCGGTGAGKSRCVRNHLLPGHQRVIVVDPIGDYPADDRVFTVADALACIREWVYTGRGHWTISIAIGRESIGQLCETLVPSRDITTSFVPPIGGVCVVLEECDLLTPRGQGGEQIASLFRRGRHVGLSAIAVTQRPANVSKETLAQADQVIAYRLASPGDRSYIASHCGGEMMETCARAWQNDYWAGVWTMRTGEVEIMGPKYEISRGRGRLSLGLV